MPVAPMPLPAEPVMPNLPPARPATAHVAEPDPLAPPAPTPVAEQFPPTAYGEEPFQTEPAYVDPSTSTLPISGR